MKGYPLFTPEQVEFIKEHVYGRGNRELMELINSRFGINVTYDQVRTFKKNHDLSSGLTGRFTKGQAPANKGKKSSIKYAPSWYKKGNRPHNRKPVGTERVSADGYVEIKVEEPKKWRGKHILVWEEHNGRPVPKGHAVIFGDRDRRNFEPDNLVLVSRKQLATMNKKNLIQDDADLTRTGIIIADIYQKIAERKSKQKDKRKGKSS